MSSRNFARNLGTCPTRVRDALEQLEGRLLPAMSFGPEMLIDSGSFQAADVNGDDLTDLAGPVGGGNVGIRLNLGGATFGPLFTVDTGLQDVTSPVTFGDVNGDGKPDLIATDSTNGKLAVLFGHGDGTFGSPTIYSDPNITSVMLADVNGDGKVDILATTELSNPSGGDAVPGGDLFLNRGDGTFDLHAGITPFAPETFADFDGDGKLDLAGVGVAANGFNAVLEVSRGNGDGTFAAPVITSIPGSIFGGLPVITARESTGHGTATIPLDMNDDGRPDIVTSGYEADVSVLLNDGHGGFNAPLTDVVANNGGPLLAIADFNGDGKPDVVYASNAGGVPAVSLNNGDGSLGPSLNFDGSPWQPSFTPPARPRARRGRF
jgi:FG-GAP-like repeat